MIGIPMLRVHGIPKLPKSALSEMIVAYFFVAKSTNKVPGLPLGLGNVLPTCFTKLSETWQWSWNTVIWSSLTAWWRDKRTAASKAVEPELRVGYILLGPWVLQGEKVPFVKRHLLPSEKVPCNCASSLSNRHSLRIEVPFGTFC